MKKAADAQSRAARIVEILSEPFQLNHNRLSISASVGTCTTHEVRETSDKILENADTALYQAKTSGRNRSVLFSSKCRQTFRSGATSRSASTMLLQQAPWNSTFNRCTTLGGTSQASKR